MMHPVEAEAIVEAWKTNQERQDYRNAIICYVVATSSGAKRKGGGQLKLSDFMPQKKSSNDEKALREKIISMAAKHSAYNGKK